MSAPGVLDCPVCDRQMAAALVEGVEIDFCDPCGIWLDAGELTALALGAVVNPRPSRGDPVTPGRFCPRCDRPLCLSMWRDTPVDVCREGHGLWLDRGELERVLASLRMEKGDAA